MCSTALYDGSYLVLLLKKYSMICKQIVLLCIGVFFGSLTFVTAVRSRIDIVELDEHGFMPPPVFPENEVYILYDLYNATDGWNWNWRINDSEHGILWNFSANANPCSEKWQGILCTLRDSANMSFVSVLQLSNYWLSGRVPSSLGNLSHLTSLSLDANYLTGSIPSTLGNLTAAEYFDLSLNFLTGTVPDAIGKLINAKQVFLYFNMLSGSLPNSFSQLANLISLQVQGNLLTGTLDGVFNSSLQTSLALVLLNVNQFQGSLPDELFLGGNLVGVVANSNCFHGTLPQSICLNLKLNEIQLACLKCDSHCVTHVVADTFVVSNAVTGSIPGCIFNLPDLQVVDMSGNDLTGSLPTDAELVPSLQGLLLSHNTLTGSIPKGFQRTGLHIFDLSHNRLFGNFLPSLKISSSASQFAVDDNRLTGALPAAVMDTTFPIDVLSGNIFSCKLDRSDLPPSDSDTVRYECGSDDYNVPYVLWLVMIICIGLAAFLVLRYQSFVERYVAVAATAATLQAWYTLASDAQHSLPVPALRHVWKVSAVLHTTACQCTLFAVLILAPMYTILTTYYGTHTDEYAWTVSSLLLAGPVPFACTFAAIVIVLSIYSRNMWSVALTNDTVVKTRKSATSLTSRVVGICFLYLLINVVIVGGANVAFVYILLYQSSVLQLAMSGFKIIWNGICTPYLARWLVHELSASRADFFTFELFVSLLNNVLIPSLAVVFISPNCFCGVFVSGGNFYYSYNDGCTSAAQCNTQTLSPTISYGIGNFTYPFRYTYLCSYTYMDYYATAFIYVSLFSTFGVPVVEVALQQLHLRARTDTLWFRILDRVLPRILKPIAADASLIPPRNVFRPYFDPTQYLISQLTLMSLILTLGVVSPPLAASLSVTMLATTTFTMLKVGRCFTNAVDAQRFEYVRLVEEECAGVGTPQMLHRAFWLMLYFSFFFITIFLFDILGETEGLSGALWVLVVVPLLPVAFYGAYTAAKFAFLQEGNDDGEVPNEVDVKKDEELKEQGEGVNMAQSIELVEVVSPFTELHNV